MAHFAKIDDSNKVLQVLVVNDKDTQDENGNEVESIGSQYLKNSFGGTWLRTSYNTVNSVHKLGGTTFRKNYAGIGSIYDESSDAFYSQPYESWILDPESFTWDAPVSYPDDGKDYRWNEATTSWVLRE